MRMSETRETRTYWLLVAVLAALGGVAVFLESGGPTGVPAGELPAPRPVVAGVTVLVLAGVYGGLGWLGLRAARDAGFPGIRDVDAGVRRWLAVPALAGGILALAFIAVDTALAPFNGFGRLPHPDFPASLVASVTAAIGEELIFRLLLVGGGYWLLTRLVRGAAAREGVFWAVTLFAAVAFTAAHVPGFLHIIGDGDPGAATLHPVLLVELLLMNGALSVVAAELLRRSGLLAAIGVHFWTDAVWHVAWGAVS